MVRQIEVTLLILQYPYQPRIIVGLADIEEIDLALNFLRKKYPKVELRDESTSGDFLLEAEFCHLDGQDYTAGQELREYYRGREFRLLTATATRPTGSGITHLSLTYVKDR